MQARAAGESNRAALPEEKLAMRFRGILAVTVLGGLGLISSGLAEPGAKSHRASSAPGQSINYSLTLGEQQFDLRDGDPQLPQGWSNVRDDVKDLHLVQFDGPIKSRWLDQLCDAGMEVIQYLPPYTYIIWGSTADRVDLNNKVESVRATGAFAPAYRVLPRWRNLAADLIDVDVLMVRAADTNAVVGEIEAAGGRLNSRAALNDVFEAASFHMPGGAIQHISQIPGVYTVQPLATDGGLRGEMSNQVNVGNYNASNQVFPGYMTWLASVGLNGAGVKIANVDGGVLDTHPNLISRMAPCVGSSCGGATSNSHGTHTAGTMVADNSSGVLDSFGFARGMGVAPGAQLVEQLYNPTYTQANGMLELMKQSYANGASLSGNSWGPSGSPLGYDNKTMQCDIGVRDTNSSLAGDKPLTCVLAIMNGNGGTSTQGTPDEAKNIFSIGSTKMQNSGSGSQILQINDVSSNSAHGPCLDGRKIPHLVAPGCYEDSTSTSNGYALLCGTSMASPHVSGGVALFIQYYRTLPTYTVDPSPALVKAAFLPVAHDLAGNVDADGGLLGHPFDNKQGWGRMNLAAVVNPPASSVQYFDQQVILDNTDEQWTTSMSPLDASKPMKIMLVWTDAPGHGLGSSTPAWNNDLDLVVEGGAGTYRGNNFAANGFSITGGTADNKNNTEGVFLPAGSGAVTIRVVGTNINSNGVPNAGDATDQDFALVVYNAAVEPGFGISAGPSSQTICAPANPVYNIDLAQILGFTDPVNLTVNLPPGVTGGFATNPVIAPASTTLNLTASAGALEGGHTLQITGTSGSIVRSVNVTLNISNIIPAAVNLASPAHGAVNVAATPTLSWSASPQTATYEVQVASDAGFNNVVYSSSTATTTHMVGSPLNTYTVYYWRVRGVNACGSGAWSSAFSFRTLDVPPILLVDDDDNSPNVRSSYTDALNALGVSYDIWDVNNNTNPEPTFTQMAPYQIIIWFSGDSFAGTSNPKAGPKAATEVDLAAWMNAGGCFFLSSQDYLYDRIGSGSTTPNSFMQQYLGMATGVDHDVNYTAVNAGANLFTGMGPYTLAYSIASGGPGVSNFSDMVNPNAGALLAFSIPAGGTAITRDAGDYRSSFFGFPLEAVPGAANRQILMSMIINWCGKLNVPCDADMNGDEMVNVADLLAVINAWGGCPTPPVLCPQDINADGQVNVSDMLSVINAWGACP